MSSDITVSHKNLNFPAYYTYPSGGAPFAGIILVHEVWGLTPNIRDIAERLRAQGYAVLAPDLLAETDIYRQVDQGIMAEIANPATKDEAQKKLRAAMAPLMAPEFAAITLEKLEACYNFLKTQDIGNGRIAIMGFCLGGTYAFSFAAKQPGLKAAIPFYGHAPTDSTELKKIACPILAFYGKQDIRLIDQVPALEKTLRDLRKDFWYKIYPHAGHAFFNDTNPATYNAAAAQDAWKRVLAFLQDKLG